MNELDDEEVAHVIDGAADVTVKSEREDSELEFTTRTYEEVVLLNNGWIRCVNDLNQEYEYGMEVSYHPPDRVGGVYTEKREDDE